MDMSWEFGLEALQLGWSGQSLQDQDLTRLPPQVVAWIEGDRRGEPEERVVAELIARVDSGRARRAAQTLWLGARQGTALGASEADAWRLAREHEDPHVRGYAALALACSASDRAGALEIFAELDPSDPLELGRTRYRRLHEISVSYEGHASSTQDVKTRRCGACRGPDAVQVWEDCYSDNSCRQERREYRCQACGLFTTDYLND
jgi:hypothetical protein